MLPAILQQVFGSWLRRPEVSRKKPPARRRRLVFESLEAKSLLAALPTGFIETRVADALSSPTALDVSSDGRVFVATQDGTIRIVKNDALLPTPFTKLTTDSRSERGLLGITLDPNFEQNQYVYVYYTASSPTSHNRVSRLTASGDTMVPGSEQILFELGSVGNADWHMGGAVHFGPDGKLYVAVGDQQNTSSPQSLNNPFGKILRINPDGSIPTDNPFYNTTTGVNKAIWAYGLRNPYTTAFQPGTGRFFINDVGQSNWEEINEGAAGKNFGWPATEGVFAQNSYPGFSQPLYAYSHQEGAAITGGAFYNPTDSHFPAQYTGDYFYADFGAGAIRALDLTTMTVSQFATGISFPTNLDITDRGELYYVSRGIGTGVPGTGTGQIFKVQYAPSIAPTITAAPTDTLASVGYGAHFDVTVAGSRPFSYQWQRNGVDIPGATSANYDLASTNLADDGAQFSVVVTNAYGAATSSAGVLHITTQLPPTATILLPEEGTTYFAGQSFHFTGSGNDSGGSELPASQYVWQVNFHHDHHSHPFIQPTGGVAELDFTIPTTGETEEHVWYRAYLTVTDALGLSTTTYHDILPVKSEITLTSNIAGLSLNLDGQPQSTPLTVEGVVGLERSLEAPLIQNVGGVTYVFSSWSNGGEAAHNIHFPANPTTYTANYVPAQVTYLSDLPFSGSATNGWGAIERNRSNGEKKNNDGRPLQLNGVIYPKGLGVHAASSVSFNLAGKYSRFLSDLGVDDEVGVKGSVRFQVLGDGKVLYQSDVLTGNSATQSIDINVAGVKTLKLVVNDGGDGKNSDHADWASARLLTSVSTPGAQTPPPPTAPFANPTGFSTGSRAHGVVTADFNRDGRPDLAVANAGAHTVSVLLGNGNGSFGKAVNYRVGTEPKSVSAADLNGDGAPDLVTANQKNNTVSVLLNKGNGTYAAAVSYAATKGAHEVALADLDGDGDVDIAEAGWGANFVRVLRNNGNGTFATGTNYAVGGAPHSVVAVDFNGDNRPDLAVADRSSNNVAVLLNQGGAVFGAAAYYVVGSRPHSLRAADLNGDSRIDLATANDGSNNISVLIGNGDGTFATALQYATGLVPKGVAIGDMNGDGRPDLITANTAGNYPSSNNPGGDTFSVLLNLGGGLFGSAASYKTGRTPFSIAVADFDGDGDQDLASANWHTNNVTVVLNLLPRP